MDNLTMNILTIDNPIMDNLTMDNITMDNLTMDNLTMDNLTTDSLAMDYLENHIKYRIAIKLWQIMSPLLILFCTFGYLLIIIVLLKKRNRNSATALYLVALAVSDLITLWTGLLRHWIIHVFDVEVRDISLTVCLFQHFMFNIGTECSFWLLVAITLERLLALCIPLKVKLLCCKLLAAVVIVSVVCVCSILNMHWFIGYRMVSLNDVTNISNILCLPETDNYRDFISNTWPWIDLSVVSFVPMAILFVCNISIISVLLKHKCKSRVQIQLRGNSIKIVRNSRKYCQVIRILILLNLVIFISTAPILVYLVREEKLYADIESIDDLAVITLWEAVVYLLSYTNNAVNVLLYVLSGSRFREEVWAVFCDQKTARFGRRNRIYFVNPY